MAALTRAPAPARGHAGTLATQVRGRSRVGWPARLAVLSLAAFAVLAVCVRTGTTQGLDVALVERLRPGDQWGATQVRWSPWMARLQPEHTSALLVLAALGTAVRRRSWWPMVLGGALGVATVAVTVATKVALARPDPHGDLTTSGGSFPSGHMATLLVCMGGCLFLLARRVRWWHWTPVAAAAVLLAVALLVSAAHWPTDVLGGALLAVAVLGASGSLGVRRLAVEPGQVVTGAVTPSRTKASSRGATRSAS